MLVLTRLGEEIIIAGNIHITVVAIQGDRVRLGVQAPPSVCIDRSEVHERRHGFTSEASNLDVVSSS